MAKKARRRKRDWFLSRIKKNLIQYPLPSTTEQLISKSQWVSLVLLNNLRPGEMGVCGKFGSEERERGSTVIIF